MEHADQGQAPKGRPETNRKPGWEVWSVLLLVLMGAIVAFIVKDDLPWGEMLRSKQDQRAKGELRLQSGLSPASPEVWKKAARFSFRCALDTDVCKEGDPTCQSMASTLIYKDESITWKCEESSYEIWKKVTEAEPTCPFPYAYLAFCYHSSRKIDWPDYALQARDIFEMTTSFGPKDGVHAQMLYKVKSLFQ